MPISFWCDCGRNLEVKEEYEGRRTTCPDCGAQLFVPSPFAAPRTAVAREAVHQGPPTTSGRAIASLVLGLLSFCLWLFAAIPAFLLGSMALGQITRSRGSLRGRTPAIMGMCFAVMGTMFWTIILVMPALLNSVANRQSNACAGNLNKLGASLKRYETKNQRFPAPAILDKAGKPLLSWRVELLQDLDPGLYNEFKRDEPWDSPSNRALLPRMPSLFACPADTKSPPELTRYRIVVGPSGKPGPHTAFEADRGVAVAEFTDGTRATWLVVEAEEAVPWTKPEDLPYHPAPWFPPPRDAQRDFSKETPVPVLGSRHPRMFHALRVDGTVETLGRGIPMNRVRARLTRDGKDGNG